MDTGNHDPASRLDQATRDFYLHALETFDAQKIPYVVGGAYALAHYTGIIRHTKDLDIFLKRADVQRAMEIFLAQGYRVERTHPHWLAKIFSKGDAFVDLIFRSANGCCDTDDTWFEHGARGLVVGRPAPLCPAEEMIWSKSYVMARERFDGADIAHLIRSRGHGLDWDRLLHRFGEHADLLLVHLVFFRFIYPSERHCIPEWVLDQLTQRLRREPLARDNICRGTMTSWDQYAMDIHEWGYRDARLKPIGALSAEEIRVWTEAEK